MKRDKIKPILFSIIKHQDPQTLRRQIPRDIVAGVVVAIVALPLSIALAIASGVGPEQGLYTAIVAGFLIALLGGSPVQISGPTAAFATIVAGIVAADGMGGLVMATIIAGVLLILMGVFRLGALIRFVPYTITTGFTAGIAVTIVAGQLKDLFGLTYPAGTPAIETMDKLSAVAANFSTFNVEALLVGAACLAVLALWPRVSKRIPGSLVAVLVGVGLVSGLDLNVNTIGDLYTINAGLPQFQMPQMSLDLFRAQFANGFTIAILAAIESLLSCVVADSMISSHHRANMELVMVFLMPYAALIPMPCIAAILLQVAYNMSGWRTVVRLVRTAPKSDAAVLAVTFLFTVVFDLVMAIGAGMMMALVLFMKRLSDETEVRGWKYYCDEDSEVTHLRELPQSVRVYEINGPMFFGMTDQIAEISVKEFTKYLIIRMRGVPSLDASAMNALENLQGYCAENGVQLIISHANEQPMRTMERAGFVDLVGREHFCGSIDDAIAHARGLLGEDA